MPPPPTAVIKRGKAGSYRVEPDHVTDSATLDRNMKHGNRRVSNKTFRLLRRFLARDLHESK